MTDIPRLIEKKRDGKCLEDDEIRTFINGLLPGPNKCVDDGQLGAMLMAIYLKKMNDRETTVLTKAMRDSGEVLSWPQEWKGKVVDKHSTGGVGDKVSLVLAPALAACGMKVPMISGRGLGHTGGTLDKLESVPGYNVSLSKEQIESALHHVGCVIAGQTANIAPADKRMYACRDVTATVDDISLVTGSIICKKAAEGIDALIMDVKCGEGAWPICSNVEDASKLAKCLVAAGIGLGINTVALVTQMDAPLGRAVGNALEVAESVRCLQNKGPADLLDIVSELGGELLDLVQPGQDGKARIKSVVRDGRALKKFQEMLNAQGVDSQLAQKLCSSVNPLSELCQAEHKTELKCPTKGYVIKLDAMNCALVTRDLGGGRMVAGQQLNHAVGLELLVEVGSEVEQGQSWVRVHHDGELTAQLRKTLDNSVTISSTKPEVKSRVLRKIP
ncbi:thymidine phosphorylase-like [Liolophura sinensis]|uniref:thymidine phosphorylase-like n=1 Tax=Liolophura sinensis TaxID=3198878 RepID=UPI0031581149